MTTTPLNLNQAINSSFNVFSKIQNETSFVVNSNRVGDFSINFSKLTQDGRNDYFSSLQAHEDNFCFNPCDLSLSGSFPSIIEHSTPNEYPSTNTLNQLATPLSSNQLVDSSTRALGWNDSTDFGLSSIGSDHSQSSPEAQCPSMESDSKSPISELTTPYDTTLLIPPTCEQSTNTLHPPNGLENNCLEVGNTTKTSTKVLHPLDRPLLPAINRSEPNNVLGELHVLSPSKKLSGFDVPSIHVQDQLQESAQHLQSELLEQECEKKLLELGSSHQSSLRSILGESIYEDGESMCEGDRMCDGDRMCEGESKIFHTLTTPIYPGYPPKPIYGEWYAEKSIKAASGAEWINPMWSNRATHTFIPPIPFQQQSVTQLPEFVGFEKSKGKPNNGFVGYQPSNGIGKGNFNEVYDVARDSNMSRDDIRGAWNGDNTRVISTNSTKSTKSTKSTNSSNSSTTESTSTSTTGVFQQFPITTIKSEQTSESPKSSPPSSPLRQNPANPSPITFTGSQLSRASHLDNDKSLNSLPSAHQISCNTEQSLRCEQGIDNKRSIVSVSSLIIQENSVCAQNTGDLSSKCGEHTAPTIGAPYCRKRELDSDSDTETNLPSKKRHTETNQKPDETFSQIDKDHNQHFSLILENSQLSNNGQLKQVDPPSNFKLTLRPYQKQALAWMLDREKEITSQEPSGPPLPSGWVMMTTQDGRKFFHNIKTKATTWKHPVQPKKFNGSPTKNIQGTSETAPTPKVRGGILADEMGMGKTIEILSLILSNRKENISFPKSLKKKDFPSKTTLIVCPLSVLSQWQQEINSVTQPGQLTVYIYHGPSRRRDVQFLSDHDIILTTYATLATEVPSERISNDSRTKNKKQKNSIHSFENDTPLMKMKWLRVVLDEAHTIKDPNTRTSKAAIALNSQMRWCVTGTPIQNKLDDLFSLFRFLRVDPYGDLNEWNRYVMRPLKNGMSVTSSFVSESSILNVKTLESDNENEGLKVLQNALSVVLLRRTKDQKINNVPLVDLPPRTINIRKCVFSPQEELFYKLLWDQSRSKFDSYLQSGVVLQNYAHILELLLRLRQACDHPSLVTTQRGKQQQLQLQQHHHHHQQQQHFYPSGRLNSGDYQSSNDDRECLSCFESLGPDAKITPCNHYYCGICSQKIFGRSSGRCLCQEVIPSDQLIPLDSSPGSNSPIRSNSPIHHSPEQLVPQISTIKRDSPLFYGSEKTNFSDCSSTKIDILLQELEEMNEEDPSTKSVVFSQWTSMLDLVQEALNRNGISYVRLDGSMSQAQRDQALSIFKTDPSVRVFLISMKAGGLGLNLVSASRVFLLDPWWNPATEAQAIDRVHRLSQTRPVLVTRLIMENTIEERILQLQANKKDLALRAFASKSDSELKKLRIEELQLLFGSEKKN